MMNSKRGFLLSIAKRPPSPRQYRGGHDGTSSGCGFDLFGQVQNFDERRDTLYTPHLSKRPSFRRFTRQNPVTFKTIMDDEGEYGSFDIVGNSTLHFGSYMEIIRE